MLNSLDNDRHQIQCLCLSFSSLFHEKSKEEGEMRRGEKKQSRGKNEAPLSKLKLEF